MNWFLHFYMARMAIFGSCSLRKRTLAERPQVPSRRSLKWSILEVQFGKNFERWKHVLYANERCDICWPYGFLCLELVMLFNMYESRVGQSMAAILGNSATDFGKITDFGKMSHRLWKNHRLWVKILACLLVIYFLAFIGALAPLCLDLFGSYLLESKRQPERRSPRMENWS